MLQKINPVAPVKLQKWQADSQNNMIAEKPLRFIQGHGG